MNKSNKSNSTSSWQASLVLSRTPFCCYDLLQTRCITRHQLLAAFLRNPSLFFMSNGLQFSNSLEFACYNCLQIPPEILNGVQVSDGHCRISQDFICNQFLVEFEVCMGSLSQHLKCLLCWAISIIFVWFVHRKLA